MAKTKQDVLRERYEEFQARKRTTKGIKYELVDGDVLRLDTASVKRNQVVKAQIAASKNVPLEA
ncbi:hypothetical protein P6A00_001971 [Vibrio parahaemolyticus]|jgi:hypothetical protein|uniref:hypothetical protein n=1 Tax=Vibrio TaxID=662 RepID=UPI00064835EF|nr:MULTISPECIES: hypothetical protein [Vibrio]EGQ7798583.1 hypothetical protein [Vibrio parahaemolyticus]EGQ9518243.1 hypothetical protein [Vibrio parahaemolyticus]EKQ5912733.1 hypothetical protein [Vibrio parahaemolyticus]ELE2165583.1 hypothetical protein [Vibrio fluvialis]MBY7780630.1 hypothetical protein [Vibrio fluvialis]